MNRISLLSGAILFCVAGATASADTDSGWVRISTSPSDVAVYVDGQFVGRSPVDAIVLPAGRHIVQIQRHGPFRWTAASVSDTIDVRTGEWTALDMVMPIEEEETAGVVVFDRGHVLSGPGDLGMKSEQWTLTAGGAMIVSGVLAAVFRDRANDAAANYLRTGDPEALSDVRRYDRLAGASMVAVQLSLGAFVLFLTTQ